MSRYDDYEDNYEDELDRMRAQRRARSEKRSLDNRQNAYRSSQRNYSGEADDDFEIEYLEDDEAPRRRTTPLERGADRYMSSKSREYDRAKRYQGRNHKPLRRKKKKPRILLIILLILVAAAAVLFIQRWMKDRDGYWNIAIFGVDSRDGNLNAGALADVQMIASINRATGEIRLVSVYRDTYVQIDDEGTFHKINEAYFKGGHEQALAAFQRNLDIVVDDYATFNWKAVADAINILGGIDLEITDSEFKYINSFITATVEGTGVYSTQLEHAGMNHLDGVQAVAYSRLRLMDTDFNRTERQRKVITLALEKAKQADFDTLRTIAATVIPEISTSIGLEDVLPLATNINRYYLGQTGGFPFARTTAMVSGMDCVIPMTLESNVVLLHQFLFDDENFVPSQSVKEISAEISEITGIYDEGTAVGADSNLTGSSGSGSSGQSAQTAPPAETTQSAPAPATSPDESLQDLLEEESAAESESQNNEEEESSEEESIEEEEDSRPIPVEPLNPEEPSSPEGHIREGPGSETDSDSQGGDNPTVYYSTRPAAETTEGYGPGFEQNEP